VEYFRDDTQTAYQALSEAQRIAFAPIVFQACRVLRDSGILERVQGSGMAGMTLEEVASGVRLPRYGVKILLESGLGIGLLRLEADRYLATKLGYFVLRDPMTRVNMDVVHEVCYRGMYDLEESLRTGTPAGLRSLGSWKTLYEGLSSLPERTRDSWLAFDHYYSDAAFPAALPHVFERRPGRLLDVGGNTGKWAVQCARFDPAVHVTIADLPQQLDLARQAIRGSGVESRVSFLAMDFLDESEAFPEGYDAIWMSQFLDCFAPREIVSILRRAGRALPAGGALHILELLWDRQPNEIAAFCLQQTSLYFACIANGNSQMYHSTDILRCIAESGLEVTGQRDQVGLYHTLIDCRRA